MTAPALDFCTGDNPHSRAHPLALHQPTLEPAGDSPGGHTRLAPRFGHREEIALCHATMAMHIASARKKITGGKTRQEATGGAEVSAVVCHQPPAQARCGPARAFLLAAFARWALAFDRELVASDTSGA
jgi:hypothetical protein